MRNTALSQMADFWQRLLSSVFAQAVWILPMSHPLIVSPGFPALPIWLVEEAIWPQISAELAPIALAFAQAQDFEAKPGRLCMVPDAAGKLAGVLFGISATDDQSADRFLIGKLPALLPEGIYRFAPAPRNPKLALLAWLLGSYVFDRYRKKQGPTAKIVAPEGVDVEEVSRIAAAVSLGRDMINTPTNDLGPDGIEDAARALAEKHGAKISVMVGQDLLEQNFPMIHAVGRASATPPRLIDIRWGDENAPLVTLVGKGVAFDTGGLNIKPGSSMALMKKDMGGAAAALATADMVMGSKLPVRLRVLIPAVENSISASSFRPGDILQSRKGLTVEIGNTDAEGRLILGDALALADEETPELLIDFATLTGAARVAVGPDLPPFYTDDEQLAADIARIGMAENDPVWRMPLWQPYASWLDSKVADINHISSQAFAGSITAALFLRRFVNNAKAYAHFDIYGWTPSEKPGRPAGGEVQAARLVHTLLKERYTS